MVRIAFIMVLGLMVSCHTPKPVSEESKTTQTPDLNQGDYYFGEVQVLDCGIVIQISFGETKYSYTPTNLESKLQVDKLRLKLKFKVLDERGTTCSEFRAIEIREAFAVP